MTRKPGTFDLIEAASPDRDEINALRAAGYGLDEATRLSKAKALKSRLQTLSKNTWAQADLDDTGYALTELIDLMIEGITE